MTLTIQSNKKRKRGRPKGSGMNPDKTVTAIRIRAVTKLMLDDLKEQYNCKTYDEVITMHLKEGVTIDRWRYL